MCFWNSLKALQHSSLADGKSCVGFINRVLHARLGTMARREETVDEELLAAMEASETATSFRVKMPDSRIGEMFAIADQILGGRRLNVICSDGTNRLGRIPGRMRRREWVRENDLIVILPWDFQDSRCDVRHRYTKTQALYLSRKNLIPEIVDIFGAGPSMAEIESEEGDDLWSDEEVVEIAEEEPDMTTTEIRDKEVDALFGEPEPAAVSKDEEDAVDEDLFD